MKALLIKDLKLMKSQKTFLAVIVVLCVWFMAADRSTSFTIVYGAAMVSLFVVSTVSYDEYDNGMAFLFTFPISRRMYVLEKYVFGLLMLAGECVAMNILVFSINTIRHRTYQLQDMFLALFAPIITMALVLSVSLPVQLKFGAEKSRMALLAGVACMGILGYGLQKVVKICAFDFSGITQRVQQATAVEAAVCICVLSAAMLGISYGISVVVMKGKQF